MNETIIREDKNVSDNKIVKVKRIKSAFIYFFVEMQKKWPNTIEISDNRKKVQIISKIWNKLRLEEKEIYFKKEEEDKKRYLVEKEKFINSQKNTTNPNKSRKIDFMSISKPVKNKSANEYFYKDCISKLIIPKNNYEKVKQKREILLKWNTLSEEDKRVYQIKAEEDEKRYKQELSSYQSQYIEYSIKIEKIIKKYEKRVISILKFNKEFNTSSLKRFLKKYFILLQREKVINKMIKPHRRFLNKLVAKKKTLKRSKKKNNTEKIYKKNVINAEKKKKNIFKTEKNINKNLEKSEVLENTENFEKKNKQSHYRDSKFINSKYKITDNKNKSMFQILPQDYLKNSKEESESFEYYSIEEEDEECEFSEQSDSDSYFSKYTDIIELSGEDIEYDKNFLTEFLSKKRQMENKELKKTNETQHNPTSCNESNKFDLNSNKIGK